MPKYTQTRWGSRCYETKTGQFVDQKKCKRTTGPTPSPTTQDPVPVTIGAKTFNFAMETLAEMKQIADKTNKRERGFLLCKRDDDALVMGKGCLGGACSIHLSDCKGKGSRMGGAFHTHPNDGWRERECQEIFSTGALLNTVIRDGVACVSGSKPDKITCATWQPGHRPPQGRRGSYPYMLPGSSNEFKDEIKRIGFSPQVGKQFDYVQIDKGGIVSAPDKPKKPKATAIPKAVPKGKPKKTGKK